ncbi:hypothetical protein [Microbacterium sp. E-13]|uniref:hypothetical protein n=1 Tax=Microbacterium sp. E-13 TaxID=3404048 RepID=UPI003CE96E5B
MGVTVLAVTSFATPALAASEGDHPAPVALAAPTDELADIRDSRGQHVRIVKIRDEAKDEKTAVAVAADHEPVLLRSLYAPEPKEPTSDATEPGLEGWVEGVNYFTDSQPRTSEEVIQFNDLPQIDPATLKLAVSTATSSTSFSAAWVDNDGTGYDIFRDGKLLESTSSGSFTQGGLKPGRDYTYTARPKEGEEAGDEKLFQVHTLPKNAADVIAKSADPMAALAMKPVASWFMYNTFITNQYVGWDILQAVGGCAGVPGDKYGGDNRVYYLPPLYVDPWDERSHRTGARMKTDWGPNYVTEDKHVGETRLYTSSGGLKGSRRASTAGIVFSERSVSSSLYSVKLSHAVGNPFCTSGAIRYAVYVNTWSSGVMQVNGYRHPVPAHEAYGLFMNSAGTEYWATMYRGAQGDFGCLSGLCPTQTISKTHTPS